MARTRTFKSLFPFQALTSKHVNAHGNDRSLKNYIKKFKCRAFVVVDRNRSQRSRNQRKTVRLNQSYYIF